MGFFFKEKRFLIVNFLCIPQKIFTFFNFYLYNLNRNTRFQNPKNGFVCEKLHMMSKRKGREKEKKKDKQTIFAKKYYDMVN